MLWGFLPKIYLSIETCSPVSMIRGGNLKNLSVDFRRTTVSPGNDLIFNDVENSEFRRVGLDNFDRLSRGDGQMAELLGLENVTAVEALLDNSLLKPVTGLVSQPGKGIRGQLVG